MLNYILSFISNQIIFIILLILVIVLIFQRRSYLDISNKILMLENSFDDEFNYNDETRQIDECPDNEISKNIKDNINTYLESGTEPSWPVIESITDREINSICEAIESKLSLPLYFGLMGTVLGIIITLPSTDWNPGADTLLLTELMGEIAMAMIATFCGVSITSIITKKYADATEKLQGKRNNFFSKTIKKIISAGNSIRQSFNPSTDMAKVMADKQIEILKEFNKSMSNFDALTQSLKQLQTYTDETKDMLKKFDSAINSVKNSDDVLTRLSGDVEHTAAKFKEDMKKAIDNSQNNIINAFNAIGKTIEEECNIKEEAKELNNSVKEFVQKEKEALEQKRVTDSLKELPQLLKNLDGLKQDVKNHTDSNKKLTESIDGLSKASNTMVEKFPTNEGRLAYSEAMLKWLKISAALSGTVAVLLVVLIAVNIIH